MQAEVRGLIRSLVAAVALFALAPLTHASEMSDDLAARRARVMDRLGPDAMLILRSAPVRNYSLDVDYEYRQDSNLYYLTGLTQADTILVLMPGNRSRREMLFVKPRDAAQERWTGLLLSREDATTQSGIPLVLTTPQFDPFLEAMLNGQAGAGIGAAEAKAFFDALAAGRGRIALALEPRTLNGPVGPAVEFGNRLRDRFTGFQITDATPILSDLRLIKTPYERTLLVRSAEISSDAQMAGMRAARAGAYEYEVKAAIEAVHRARGAVSWAYPSIVGSGPDATILHYGGSERQMRTGELLLVDAGANYQYMSADITRTYPVGGTFSQAQKDIYAVVLQAQEEAITVAKPGNLSAQIHARTVEVIKDGLLKLGLITDTRGDQYKMWYDHGATHYIGIDVHDVGERAHPLQPGMAFTIEPGIYVRPSVLDGLPKTPENVVLIERIRPAVQKYADIGIRIEDSFLLEERGLKNLSAAVPRTIEEVEAFMRTGRASANAR
jgi:Xaa-Pro aminopeptidase